MAGLADIEREFSRLHGPGPARSTRHGRQAMKFTLSEERRGELSEPFAALDQWIAELHELDLARYDPLLVPARAESETDAAAADD